MDSDEGRQYKVWDEGRQYKVWRGAQEAMSKARRKAVMLTLEQCPLGKVKEEMQGIVDSLSDYGLSLLFELFLQVQQGFSEKSLELNEEQAEMSRSLFGPLNLRDKDLGLA